MTGLRDIGSFLVEGEAGKGAYGTVRKARLKGVGGEAVGVSFFFLFFRLFRSRPTGVGMLVVTDDWVY